MFLVCPANSVFRCKPRLDTNRAGHRNVAPEFWWKSEAIYTRDHHQKVRRRDLAIGLVDVDQRGWKTTFRTANGPARTVIVFNGLEASLRQTAHEVLHSKDMLKLAGR